MKWCSENTLPLIHCVINTICRQAVLDAEIDEDNAIVLTPWFHEFSMGRHLDQCDEVLGRKTMELSHWENGEDIVDLDNFYCAVSSDESFWKVEKSQCQSCENERKSCFKEMIDLLQFSYKYDLQKTQQSAELALSHLIDILEHTSDLFDMPTIKAMVQLCLPIEKNRHGDFIPISSKAHRLWHNCFAGALEPHREHLAAETINSNELAPLLLHAHLLREMNTQKASILKKSGKSLVRSWLDISKRNSSLKQNGGRLDSRAAATMRSMLHRQSKGIHKEAFELFGVTVPDSFSWVNNKVLQFIKESGGESWRV